MANVTDSLNFYVGRPANVSDMRVHRQVAGKFAWEEKGISVFPGLEIGGEFGKCVLFDAISRDSVLSSLSLSLLAVIHVFTSEMQSCKLWTEACI